MNFSKHKDVLWSISLAVLTGTLPAQAEIFLSNTNGSLNGNEAVNGNANGSFQAAGQSFETGTGSNALNNLTIVAGPSGLGARNPPNDFSLALYKANLTGGVGTLITDMAGSANPTNTGLYTYTPDTPVTLAPDTTYWWVASGAVSGTVYGYSLNDTPSNDPTLVTMDGWSMGESGNSQSGSWNYYSTPFDLMFSVDATAESVPEPTVPALAVMFGLGGLWILGKRQKLRAR